MALDRRSLLKQIGVGIAAGSILTPVRSAAGAASVESVSKEPGGPIRLNHNENAYGPSKKAIAAIQETAGQVYLYPDTTILQNALASHHGVKQEQIVLGCGSSDVLRSAASAFLGPGTALITAAPTCDLMAHFGRDKDASVQEVPLRKDHAHDLNAMLERSNGSAKNGLIYVCNPNSPTSTLSTRQDIEDFLGNVSLNFHVVIDEAYHDYAGGSGAYASFLDRPVGNPRVIVTRTFSTSHGLAGSRVGYAVTSAPVARKMAQASLPFAISNAGMSAAVAALADRQHIETSVRRNFDDRQEFMNQVNARMLRALDSHTNFICLNVMRPAGEIIEHYRKNNFLLAPLIPSMPNYLRISLGIPERMREFWRVWDLLGSHPMSM
jgi:histidinol-phosphate aminotransferase